MCRNFVPNHRDIGTIWCNFKRFNTIIKSEIFLKLKCKMTYVTDQFQPCFCFELATLNSYILFLHSQHNWHLCRQLATYSLSCRCILVFKSGWRHRCRCPCNWTKTTEEHIIVFCTWYRGEFSFSSPWAFWNWGSFWKICDNVIQISTTRARYIHCTSCCSNL